MSVSITAAASKETAVTNTLSTSVAFGGGIRYAWQEQAAVGTFSGEMVFAQITLRAGLATFVDWWQRERAAVCS